jgi:hypothetical protein
LPAGLEDTFRGLRTQCRDEALLQSKLAQSLQQCLHQQIDEIESQIMEAERKGGGFVSTLCSGSPRKKAQS